MKYLPDDYGEDANETYEQPVVYTSMSAAAADLEVATGGLINGDEDMEAEYTEEADGDDQKASGEWCMGGYIPGVFFGWVGWVK